MLLLLLLTADRERNGQLVTVLLRITAEPESAHALPSSRQHRSFSPQARVYPGYASDYRREIIERE